MRRRVRTVEDLSGGLTNRNLKVTTPDGTFVARLNLSDSKLLDIDREAEAFNTRVAETAGVGAPYVDFRPDLGMLVIGFIEGRTFTDDDLRVPGALERLSTAVRALDTPASHRNLPASRPRLRSTRSRQCRATTTCSPATSSTTAAGSG